MKRIGTKLKETRLRNNHTIQEARHEVAMLEKRYRFIESRPNRAKLKVYELENVLSYINKTEKD